MAEAVGEVLVGVQRHLLDRGHLALERRVAEPHRGLGIDRTEREELRHAFGEPERRGDGDEGGDAGAGAAPRPDVVLELVGHLVLQDVLEVGVGAGERHHRPVPREVGHAAGALAAHFGRVGLLEVGAGGVEDDRLALPELVVQHLREPGVRALGHAGGVHRGHPLALVEVHVEVLGLDDLELEVGVLHLVPPEVLGGQPGRA